MQKKTWDKSWTKSISTALLSYIVVLTLLTTIKTPNPFISSVLPAGVLVLAIRYFELIRKWWLAKFN